jgi:hypothetical protein
MLPLLPKEVSGVPIYILLGIVVCFSLVPSACLRIGLSSFESGDSDAGVDTTDNGTDGSSTGGDALVDGGEPRDYTRVFHDGFEDGTTNLWTDSGAEVTTADPHGGTYAARSNWNGLVLWNDPESIRGLSLRSWPYAQEFLVRFWLRIDPDVDASPEGGSGGCLFRLPFGNDKEGNEISWSRSITYIYLAVDSNAERSVWGCANFEDRAWHQVEIYVKDAIDGAIRFWVDDAEVTCTNSWGESYPYYGNTHLNEAGWDTFYWPSGWSGAEGCCEHDAENHMYLDDVEIFSDALSGDPSIGVLADGNVEAI